MTEPADAPVPEHLDDHELTEAQRRRRQRDQEAAYWLAQCRQALHRDDSASITDQETP